MTTYSKWGLTIDLYKFRNISLSMYVKVLNTISRLRSAFKLLILVLICSLNFNALSMIIPKSFSLDTFSISICSCPDYIVYVVG